MQTAKTLIRLGLIWVFACRTGHFVGFVMRLLNIALFTECQVKYASSIFFPLFCRRSCQSLPNFRIWKTKLYPRYLLIFNVLTQSHLLLHSLKLSTSWWKQDEKEMPSHAYDFQCKKKKKIFWRFKISTLFKQKGPLAWLGKMISEPPHDKTNKMTVRAAKTQISLGIRPVWSESSLSAWRKLGSLATHWAHSEYPGWSELSLGAHSFCWFCHVVAHVVSFARLYSVWWNLPKTVCWRCL